MIRCSQANLEVLNQHNVVVPSGDEVYDSAVLLMLCWIREHK